MKLAQEIVSPKLQAHESLGETHLVRDFPQLDFEQNSLCDA